MNRDFYKGAAIWLMAIATLYIIGNYIARSVVYSDQKHEQDMVLCQQVGYTYGECYDSIIGYKDDFAK